MGLLEDLSRLDLPIEKLEVPEGVNRAFASFCAEIDRLDEKVMRVTKARNITEPTVAQTPSEEVKPKRPLQQLYTFIPINIFPKSVLCTICGTQAIAPCGECELSYCRLCHYSSLHTCETKL
jgi:hypothetical protein